MLPLNAHDPFSQVSAPNSPALGMVLKVQFSLPVLASKARTLPLVLLRVTTVIPSLKEDPTIMVSLTIKGVECRPTSPFSRSIC